jgi:dihydrolipoamide dehydrogenase
MTYDVLVIGAGPAGYVCAIRCAQLGLKTAVVEKENLGGVCLNVGCIPSKALIAASKLVDKIQHADQMGIKAKFEGLDVGALVNWKAGIVNKLTSGVGGLLKNHKVDVHSGDAKVIAKGKVEVKGKDGTKTLEAKNIVLAVGSTPIEVPGFAFDGESVWSSTHALAPKTLPKRMIVIGGGYIGLELGSVWRRLGAKVTVLEYADRILTGIDTEIASEALTLFKKQGLDIRLGVKVTSARAAGGGCIVECEGQEPIRCDRVLAATGRAPATDGLGLETLGIQVDRRGCIPVDGHFRTTAPGVWAIGDCIPGPMLAHRAEEDGVACVDGMAGRWAHVDYALVPAVVFTHPEIAAVGRTEEQLVADGVAFKKGVFPFRANGRARTINETVGKVKVLADAATDRVLGVHVIGPAAGDMIGEAAAAMNFGATAEDIARVCHAHPTLPEALKEAALAVDGRAIHA